MIGWLNLTEEQRKLSLTQAESESGIGAKLIEKDWWVTLTLKALFQSAYADHMVFKGGTSLSKGWKLISRFSEDVDIALDPLAFDMPYYDSPTKQYVKKLRKNGCKFTSTMLKVELEKQFASFEIPNVSIIIESAPIPTDFPDTDPQTIYVKYPSLYPPIPYISDEVKIEISVRSLKIPYTSIAVQSLLHEYFPNEAYTETSFQVPAVEPKKTFLEKAFLLHEEFLKPDITKIRSERMSRHPYDLVIMMDTPFAEAALNDHILYQQLISHRKFYTAFSWVNYESLNNTTISFVPPPSIVDIYQQDYSTMQEQMIYGDSPDFSILLEKLNDLQQRFRSVKY